jgi:hypothetical protein
MRAWRITLSVLTAAWGLLNLFPLLGTIAGKLGPIPQMPGWPVDLRLLLEQIPWWDVAVWAAMIVMYLLAALALKRGRQAFRLYVVAFIAELVRWLPIYSLPIYTQTWTSWRDAIPLHSLVRAGRCRRCHLVD